MTNAFMEGASVVLMVLVVALVFVKSENDRILSSCGDGGRLTSDGECTGPYPPKTDCPPCHEEDSPSDKEPQQLAIILERLDTVLSIMDKQAGLLLETLYKLKPLKADCPPIKEGEGERLFL